MLRALAKPTRQMVKVVGAAAIAVVALAVTAGCSGATPDTSPTPSQSSTVTPAESDATEKALANVKDSYNKLQEALIKAGETSDYNNAEIGMYASGSLALDLRRDLRQRQQQDLIQTGRPTWTITSASADLPSRAATLTVCWDGTNAKLVKKSTGADAGVPGQAKKFVINSTAQLYDNGMWRIETSVPDRSKSC